MKSNCIVIVMLTVALLSSSQAKPIQTSIKLSKRDISASMVNSEWPNIVTRTIKDSDSEKPLSFEEEYTTPGGTHVKKGGFYDPSTGSRGSYSSSSFHKEWHSP